MVDRAGLATHIGLRGIGTGLAASALAFSAPKARPVSGPELPTFTLATPKSYPAAPASQRLADRKSVVKKLLLRP